MLRRCARRKWKEQRRRLFSHCSFQGRLKASRRKPPLWSLPGKHDLDVFIRTTFAFGVGGPLKSGLFWLECCWVSFVRYNASADGSRKSLVPHGILYWIKFMCFSPCSGGLWLLAHGGGVIEDSDVSSLILQYSPWGPESEWGDERWPSVKVRALSKVDEEMKENLHFSMFSISWKLIVLLHKCAVMKCILTLTFNSCIDDKLISHSSPALMPQRR